MVDDTRDATGGGRRKPPTIDLKATEIASGPVKNDQASEKSDEKAKPEVATTSAEVPPAAAAKPVEPKAADAKVTEPKPADSKPAEPKKAEAGPGRVPPAGGAATPAAGSATSWLDARLIAASAAGAAVMLVVFLLILASGALSPRDDVVTLLPRLAQLEAQTREAANRPAPQVDQRALAELAARVGAAEQAMRRLADLETRLARAEQGGAKVGELDARLAKTEQGVARLSEIEQRIARAEGAAGAPRAVAGAPDGALAERIAVLENAMRPFAEFGAKLETAGSAARDAKARADAAFEAAQKVAPTAAADHQAIETLTARVAALEQATKTAQERIASTAGADKAGRLAFVAIALRAAVERGDAYAGELAAAKPLVTDAKAISALEPFAATGVPRNAALARELSGLTGAMLNAAGAPARDGGFIDRLQQNAERLVRIRPINETPGDDAATVISRADVKAAHGDVAGALAEVKSLPAAVRAPAENWIKKVEAQAQALTAARNLADGAVGALAKP
jgi:hypothetical protein